MTLYALLKDFPNISIANETHNLEILEYYHQTHMTAQSTDIIYKRGSDFFAFMKEKAEPVNPFFGEEDYENPWGIASWIKANHTEWISLTFERFNIDYKLIDAQLVEEFLYENLIAKDPNLSKLNSANLIFIADDMDKVDFLHNYKLTTDDPSTEKRHEEIGLMGYGGKYNTYFFD